MNPQQTKDYLKYYQIDYEPVEGRIQRIRWTASHKSAVTVSLWIATSHPVVLTLAESFIPHMDACICLWHDHRALSCMRVKETMACMEKYARYILLMATTYPRVFRNTGYRVSKYFDQNGFERPLNVNVLLSDMIQNIIHNHCTNLK